MKTGECLGGRPKTTPAKSHHSYPDVRPHLMAPKPTQCGPGKHGDPADHSAPPFRVLQAVYRIKIIPKSFKWSPHV